MLSIHTLLIDISNNSVFDLLVFSVSHVENYDVYACIIVMVQCRGNEPFAKLFTSRELGGGPLFKTYL